MKRLESLSHSIEQLETYYIGLTSRYPPILDFLEEHITEVENRISNGKMRAETGSIRSWIESQDSQVERIQRDQLTITRHIESIISYGSDSEIEITEIRENSQDLEIYSLNAMVSAIKSGKNGGAFPYLTKEMQKVSRQSLQLSEDLSNKGQSLFKNLTMINGRILNDSQKQSGTISEVKELVDTFLRKRITRQDILIEHVKRIRSLHSKLRIPINKIVMEVQKQDIFRQSIDHIFLTHKQFDHFSLTSLEDELDYLKFSTDTYDFSSMVVEEIIADLKDSIAIFDSCHNEISLSAPSLTEINSMEEDLKNTTNGICDSIQKRLILLKEDQPQDKLGFKKAAIHPLLNEMQSITREILKLVEKVNMINISNKIEITRNDEIRGIYQAVNNVDLTSHAIAKKISYLQEYINTMQKRLTDGMNDYIASHKNYSDFLCDYSLNLNQFVEYFRQMGEQLIQLLGDLKSFSDSYKELEKNLDIDIQQTRMILLQLQNISSYFKEERESFQNRLAVLLKETEYDTWTLKNLKVQKLLDKFTIFTHKRAFSQQEAEESQGALSGEVILF